MTDRPPPTDVARSLLAPAALPPWPAQPVLVVGSVRSGTSTVAEALRSGAGLPGHAEGHATSLLQRLLDVVDETVGTFDPASDFAITQTDPDGLRTTIVNWFSALLGTSMPDGRWLDKTPDDFPGAPAIRATPRVLELFPAARVVCCRRRGIENVLSRQQKFPDVPFWYHCRSWATAVTAWEEVAPRLGGAGLLVEQHDLALRPDAVAAALGRHLDLDAEQVAAVEHSIVTGGRVEQGRPATDAIDLGLDETGWDPPLVEIFLAECGDAMALAGYGLEHHERAPDPGIALFLPEARGVVDTHGGGGGRARYVDVGTFVLPPGPAGEPASLHFPALPLGGRRRFTVALGVQGTDPRPVRYRIEVREPGGVVQVDESIVVRPGRRRKRWTVDAAHELFPACDVHISAALDAPGSPDGTEAVWEDPRFT